MSKLVSASDIQQNLLEIQNILFRKGTKQEALDHLLKFNIVKINDEDRHGNIIRETGEIIIYDSNDDIEFDGYMYNGGNTIAGKWKGKEVVLYGVGD